MKTLTIWANNANEMGDNLSAVNLGAGRTAIRIATGLYHTCAVLDNNSVKCWGYNTDGQLGLEHALEIGDDVGEIT